MKKLFVFQLVIACVLAALCEGWRRDAVYWRNQYDQQKAIVKLWESGEKIAYTEWQPYSEESVGIDNRKDCESAPPDPFMVHGVINQWRDGRCGYIFPLDQVHSRPIAAPIADTYGGISIIDSTDHSGAQLILVDKEVMCISKIFGGNTIQTFQVVRGCRGTQAAPHAAGALAYFRK